MTDRTARERELEIRRIFDAPRDRVWRAWTQPPVMARWLHPHGLRTPEESVTVDLRVGGRFRFSMVDAAGAVHASGGEYLEVREHEILRCTWGAPEAPVAELEVRLAEIGPERTEMIFRLHGHRDDTGDGDSVWTGWREAIAELDEEMGEAHG